MDNNKWKVRPTTVILTALIISVGFGIFCGFFLDDYKVIVDVPPEMKEEYSDALEMLDETDYNPNSDVAFVEEDYGNKVDPDKPYVYTVKEEYKEYEYDGEGSINHLRLFKINMDSDDVNKINKEVEDYYNKYKSYYLNEEWTKEEKPLPQMEFYYNTRDEILSLNMFYGNEDDDYNQFKNYKIDINTKKLISNEEFFEKKKISKADFEKYFEDTIYEMYLECEDTTGEYAEHYGTFENFKKNIVLTRNEEAKGKEPTFENICKYCYIFNPPIDYAGTVTIQNIVVPYPYGTDDPLYDNITLKIEPIYIFSRDYAYKYQDYSEYRENYGNYASNHVPVINIKSDDAEKVNKELLDFYNKGKEAIEKNGGEIITKAVETDEKMEITPGRFVNTKDEIIVNKNNEKVIDDYYTITYHSQIIDEKILTILVEETNSKYSNLDHGMWDYKVYNFNIETGKLLTNKELIEMLGSTEEEFMSNLGMAGDIEDFNISVTNKDIFNLDSFDAEPTTNYAPRRVCVFTGNGSEEWKEVKL